MRFSFLLIPVAALTLASAASAQVAPFSIRVQQGSTVSTVSDGATITMAADAIGISNSASISISYTGTVTNPVTSFNTPDFSGSTDFTISGYSDSITLLPKQSFSVNVAFKPATSNRVTGRIIFNYVESGKAGSFTLNLVGTAPEFAFSYIPQGGNATLISPGGKIVYPVTTIDSTSSAVFVLTNRGSGAGNVASIKIAGDTFQLAGVPLANTPLDAGKDLKFSVNFTPKQIDLVSGALTLDLASGRYSFGLEGSGSGPMLSFATVQNGASKDLQPGELITFPDAVVGEKSTITVSVLNGGNADARLTNISASGAGFAVTDAPFVPYTLTPDSTANVTVTFTPTQAGRVTGRLRIGNDTFELAGSGLGSVMTYSYTMGSTVNTVQNNGSVIFTPVAVGKNVSALFVITNTGTAPTAVSSISIAATGASTIWTLSDLPAVPTSIAPNKTVSFTVAFAPNTTGAATATLKIDTQSFILSGSGNPPPALSDFKFDGATGPQEALQQPAVGLLLSTAYPIPLTGTLTMTFNSEVAVTDPAVQFATGGKTVNFTIPANSTRAIFSNGAQQIKLQTGSVAGAISLTPSFVTDGGINLTPTNPPSLNLTVAQSAPKLLSVQVSAKTSTGFTLLVTGYATGRSVTQIDLQFVPTADETVQTTKLSIPAEPSFLAWYASSASQAYGSLFTVTLPFTLSGSVNKVTNLSDTVQSVTVSLTNRTGTSSSMKVDLK